MSAPEFPEWAPPSAREVWRDTPPGEVREVLFRLLTDPFHVGMADAWAWALSKHRQDWEQNAEATMFCLASDLVAAYEGLPVEARHKEIAKTAAQLARLIDGTPLAGIELIRIDDRFQTARAWEFARRDGGDVPADRPTLAGIARTLGEFLGELAEEAPALVASGVTVGNAKREEARRLYFVRYLDRALRKRYGCDPVKFIVPATVVAFGKFSPQQYYRNIKSQWRCSL